MSGPPEMALWLNSSVCHILSVCLSLHLLVSLLYSVSLSFSASPLFSCSSSHLPSVSVCLSFHFWFITILLSLSLSLSACPSLSLDFCQMFSRVCFIFSSFCYTLFHVSVSFSGQEHLNGKAAHPLMSQRCLMAPCQAVLSTHPLPNSGS